MTMNRNLYPCVEFDLDLLAENLAALVERCHDSLIEVAGVVRQCPHCLRSCAFMKKAA